MTFLRRKYRQPPRMWGPRANVQAAVRENAEKIYGFDPDSVTIAIPVWDNQTSLIKNFPTIMNYGVVPDTDPVLSGIPVFEGKYSQGGGADRIHIEKPLLLQEKGSYFVDFRLISSFTAYSAFLNIENISNNSTHELFFGVFTNLSEIWFSPNLDQSAAVRYRMYTSSVFPSIGSKRLIGISWLNGSGIDGYRDGEAYGAMVGGDSWIASAFTDEKTYFRTQTSTYFAPGRTSLQIGLTEPTTADQQALLHDYKYGLFQPIKRVIYSLPTGTSGSTLLPIMFNHYNKNIGT